MVGLDSDLATLSRSNRDGYELFLSQLISNAISGNANSYCKVVFHELEGKDVCEVIVDSRVVQFYGIPIGRKDVNRFLG